MIPKPLDNITKEDIESLKALQVMEGLKIDYKRDLPGPGKDARKEFLADVSSFANAEGGDLLFGVDEKDGIPTNLLGVNIPSEDSLRQELDNVIYSGLEPRVTTVRMRAVPGFPNGSAFVLRIGKSWNAPHMVTIYGSSRFFTRNNSGKQQMHVPELRAAFLASETFAEKVRAFRAERIAEVLGDRSPVVLQSKDRLLLHLVPFGAFSPGNLLSAETMQGIEDGGRSLQPMGASGWDHRYNFDGFMTFSASPTQRASQTSTSYVQVFRGGPVECAHSNLLVETRFGWQIPCVGYEKRVVQAVGQCTKAMKSWGIVPPILVMLSLLNVKGTTITAQYTAMVQDPREIDRDHLVLPDVLIESYDQSIPSILRPAFDVVWQASGLPRSFNYLEDGTWNPQA